MYSWYFCDQEGRKRLPAHGSVSCIHGPDLPAHSGSGVGNPSGGFLLQNCRLALFVYSCFPIISNTVSGLNSLPRDLVDASRGLGMTEWQILLKTELPLAAPVIVAGIRTSTIINIGTATIGAVAGAGGLGTVLMAGLIHDNGAYIFTGALCAALLAFFTDKAFALLDSRFRRLD